MRKITFDEEELFAIAVFGPGSREETAAKMSGVLEELTEDPDMHALIMSASEKLKRISDREFKELSIDGYREELAWEEEEDPEATSDSENPGEESRIHNGIQNATEAASEAEKDNTRNVGSSTPANSAGTAQKTEKEGSQAKNKAGGDT